MIFQDVVKSGTASSGSFSVNSDYMRGMTALIYVKAASSSTTFDFKIIDSGDRIVRHYQDEEGVLRDIDPLPVFGIYTFTVENASVDEKFDIFIRVREKG